MVSLIQKQTTRGTEIKKLTGPKWRTRYRGYLERSRQSAQRKGHTTLLGFMGGVCWGFQTKARLINSNKRSGFWKATCMTAKSLQSCPTLCDPVDLAFQAPLSMGFSRQEYWSGWPCSPPEDLPSPGIETTSLMYSALANRFFTTNATW